MGGWRHPEAVLDDFLKPGRYAQYARTLEDAKFDGCFFADLLGIYDIYGGMPAIPEDRPGFFANLDTRTAPNKIDWSVAQEMIKYPDIPNHEAWLPNLTKANDLFGKFRTTMDTQPGLNMDTEIDKLQTALDAVFKEVKK